MKAEVGDRIKINPHGSYPKQAAAHPGEGTVKQFHKGMDHHLNTYVVMDDGYCNAYNLERDLILVHPKMLDPDFELEELELAESVIQSLQKA